jgi:hypothetical protein
MGDVPTKKNTNFTYKNFEKIEVNTATDKTAESREAALRGLDLGRVAVKIEGWTLATSLIRGACAF